MPSKSLLATDEGPAFEGPAILAKGFRPFFLLAGAYAVAALPIWLVSFLGYLQPSAYMTSMFWHAHEMVFGFAVAVIAGFLLTAASNWTKRPTATGLPLLALALLWLLGRVSIVVGAALPTGLAMAVDLAFLPALALAIGRPIIATRNSRNLGFLGLLVVLELANLATHLGALGVWPAGLHVGHVVAIDAITLMMVVVASRIVPMFTRNALDMPAIRSIPWLDWTATSGLILLTIADALSAGAALIAVVSALTAVAVMARTRHWGSWHTLHNPLLWILHVGHAFIGVGLALRAAAIVVPWISLFSALHALTVGAIGCLTLGMMARVGLGHTGRMLVASHPMTFAFSAMVLAALIRVAGPWFGASLYLPAVVASSAFWIIAFVIYLWRHVPILIAPRVDGRPG